MERNESESLLIAYRENRRENMLEIFDSSTCRKIDDGLVGYWFKGREDLGDCWKLVGGRSQQKTHLETVTCQCMD